MNWLKKLFGCSYDSRLASILAENQLLRGTVKFYARESHWPAYFAAPESIIGTDQGMIARAVLGFLDEQR